MEMVEKIVWQGREFAYIIRAEVKPEKTTFLTPNEFNMQVGFVVYPADGQITRHVHRPLARHIQGTTELLLVRQGRCLMDIYNDEREVIATCELRTGDLLLMVAGGHGFRMLEDTTFLEVKQGPYTGLQEKERF